MELTQDELRALNDHVSPKSYVVNEKIRNGIPLDSNDRAFVDNLDTALDKLPRYEGDISRSMILSGGELQEFLRHHQVGQMVTYDQFTSFTYGDIYQPLANVQVYVNNSKKAVDISCYNLSELEVLYPRNSRFIVDEIEVDSLGTFDIALREV